MHATQLVHDAYAGSDAHTAHDEIFAQILPFGLHVEQLEQEFETLSDLHIVQFVASVQTSTGAVMLQTKNAKLCRAHL